MNESLSFGRSEIPENDRSFSPSLPVDLKSTREEIGQVLAPDPLTIWSTFQEWMQQVSRLPENLRKMGMYLLCLVLLASLQGCMYAPRYEDIFRRSSRPLTEIEIQSRGQLVRDLLADPSVQTATPALQSGIEPFQRERIWNNFSDLVQKVDSVDFDAYVALCNSAKSTLGIMNPDRYDPDFLRAVLDNYNNPELLRDKPVILALLARKDRQSIGGIQALNVETYRLQELARGYKVLVVETSTVNEILHHVNSLSQRGILRLGNLQGILIAGHGSTGMIDVGLTVEQDFMKISRLNWYLMKNSPSYVVFASCESGDGGMNGFDGFSNFANRAKLLFPSSDVLACNGYVVGIDFQTDDHGRIRDHSIRLKRLSDLFSSSDTTYKPQYDRLLDHAIQVYRPYLPQHIPDQYLRFALQAGLINSQDIVRAFQTGIDPFEFRIYLDCGFSYQEIDHFFQSGISAPQVFEYIQAGVWSRPLILDLARNRIPPERFRSQRQGGR
ncbi:MAG: hypothetical protein AB7J40_06215 [Candidatus Altimarinota bacterium]